MSLMGRASLARSSRMPTHDRSGESHETGSDTRRRVRGCRRRPSPLGGDAARRRRRGDARQQDQLPDVGASKLPRIRLHDLRHTHTSLALAAGINPKVISERLGNATVSITLDTYSHAIPALQEKAAERIAGLVLAEGQTRVSSAGGSALT
jgi:integrase